MKLTFDLVNQENHGSFIINVFDDTETAYADVVTLILLLDRNLINRVL